MKPSQHEAAVMAASSLSHYSEKVRSPARAPIMRAAGTEVEVRRRHRSEATVSVAKSSRAAAFAALDPPAELHARVLHPVQSELAPQMRAGGRARGGARQWGLHQGCRCEHVSHAVIRAEEIVSRW
jgi:hypothetical protein